MTKFYLASDLHLEFGELRIENTDNVDCLILAGDVVEIKQLKKDGTTKKPYIAEFFKQINSDFKQVIWIPGNHEYYGCYFMQKSINDARAWLVTNGLTNIRLCDAETVLVENTPVHCATLWTDMNRGNALIAYQIQNALNDYRCIRGATPTRAGSRISTKDIEVIHSKHLRFLDDATADGKDCVVVTHHQPTPLALNSRRISDIDYAYASDLSEFFLDRPHIKVWCSGHNHASMQQIDIGEQRFLTNCRGYHGHEEISRFFDPMLFEI